MYCYIFFSRLASHAIQTMKKRQLAIFNYSSTSLWRTSLLFGRATLICCAYIENNLKVEGKKEFFFNSFFNQKNKLFRFVKQSTTTKKNFCYYCLRFFFWLLYILFSKKRELIIGRNYVYIFGITITTFYNNLQ